MILRRWETVIPPLHQMVPEVACYSAGIIAANWLHFIEHRTLLVAALAAGVLWEGLDQIRCLHPSQPETLAAKFSRNGWWGAVWQTALLTIGYRAALIGLCVWFVERMVAG